MTYYGIPPGLIWNDHWGWISEDFGRSPAMDALPALQAFNALPADERSKLSAEMMIVLLSEQEVRQ